MTIGNTIFTIVCLYISVLTAFLPLRRRLHMYQFQMENESHLVSLPKHLDETEAIEEAIRKECIVAFY